MKSLLNIQQSINSGILVAVMSLTNVCQAQVGVLEIHGTLTTPSCKLNSLAMVLQDKQAMMNGKACGLTQNANNRLSVLTIARIGEEQTVAGGASATLKRTVILTYE